ncbi:unnamed protein product, partial [Musa acuminata subsp. burmannicoides]
IPFFQAVRCEIKKEITVEGFKASVLVRCMWSPQLSHHRAKHSASGPPQASLLTGRNDKLRQLTHQSRWNAGLVAWGVVARYDVAPLPTSARLPGILSSKTLAPPPYSDPRAATKLHRRGRIRNPAFPGAGAEARLRKGGPASGGRRSGPTTPLLRWKFNEAPPPKPSRKAENAGSSEAPPPLPGVSARKLAAGIWHLQPLDAGSGVRGGGGEGRRTPPCLEFAGFPSAEMEKATKWDPGSSMTLEEVYRFYNHLKVVEHEDVNTVSIVSSLCTELEKAHARISELETEQRSAKKKLDQFLKSLADEKASWQSREHEKVQAIIEAMKADLDRERKRRQRIEIVHTKLVNELAETKLAAKQLLQDYKKECKARELVEEVCDELTKEIGEDKAEIESLKMEALNIREQVEEEKRMLQMAEVWREERVQMKLIDAKLTLEEKYSQLRDLKAELEAFLAARMDADMDVAPRREAELLKVKANSVTVEEIKEFSYQPPPASEDIYAVFEEPQPRQETNERDIQLCCNHSPRSHASKVNTASPETDVFLGHPMKQHELIDSDDDVEDDSDWETVSHAEEQGSSNTLDVSEPSVNGYCKESNASVSIADWEENGNNRLNNEIITDCSANAMSRKKVSSICRLWRSSTHDIIEDLKRTPVEVPGRLSDGRISNGTRASTNGEEYQKLLVEHAYGRLSNGMISKGTLSPDLGFGEVGLSPGSITQWSSADSLNLHTTRGMKGCIKWPRGKQKYSLKAQLMEARMESQKIQLRHVLKQKI